MNSFNPKVLTATYQDLISEYIKADVARLALKGFNSNVDSKLLIEQIEAKQRCEKKLPTWFNTANIYYPNKLNIEQTSSEQTAIYKSKLVSGNTLIDATGGFGVDCYYFSQQMKNVIHCDINSELSLAVTNNYKALNKTNISCKVGDGLDIIKDSDETIDWIYIDPSRRDNHKGRVFLLEDCLPNVPANLNMLFSKSKNILIKTAPLLDISAGLNELNNVKEIHIVALNNDVKELLWVLEKGYTGEISLICTNLTKTENQTFNFTFNQESEFASYSLPLNYIYEPNSAILKGGAFNAISNTFNLDKLHQHSHLYTSEELIDFPGRRFKLLETIPYNKKQFKRLFKGDKANITTRNFPESVQQIRNKLKLKDGGDFYLFFTTDIDNNKICLVTKKA